MKAEPIELAIARLGAQGDGVSDGGIYVPFALPGERVRALRHERDRAALIEVLQAAPDRTAPFCSHFGTCGGCRLQHLAPCAQLEWKREQVRLAFAARGLSPSISPVVNFPAARRRRATFAARRTANGTAFGFHAAGTNDIVPIVECPILAPGIENAISGLRVLAGAIRPRGDEIRIAALQAENGLAVDVDGAAKDRGPKALEEIARIAAGMGLIRLTIEGETIYSTAPPAVRFGAANVTPPPFAFLQAMAEAEMAMAALVKGAFRKAKRVADLFCGLGAFTFPLAERIAVSAYDGDAGMIGALQAASRKAQGLKPIAAGVRDLFRVPLSATELKQFDGVVFDAPRAGAAAQAAAIARSKTPIAVAVSCDMATLARDARTLVDGGYAIASVTPFDQFQHSAHVEAVAVFRR